MEKESLSCHSYLYETDPEFVEIIDNFINNEVAALSGIDEKTRYMAIMATLIGCGGKDEFKNILPDAIDNGLTPVEVKEIVYHAVPYLGIGRVLPFLNIVNDYFKEINISLPLPGQRVVSGASRAKAGSDAIIKIFNEDISDVLEEGPYKGRHIDYWLCSNCFGDYFTRNGLNIKQREMITLCMISAQGGCEPQLADHAEANIRVGNNKDFLLQVIAQCLPYIGFPRTLNAIRCINEADKNFNK